MRIARHKPRAKAFAIVFSTHYILSYLEQFISSKNCDPSACESRRFFCCLIPGRKGENLPKNHDFAI